MHATQIVLVLASVALAGACGGQTRSVGDPSGATGDVAEIDAAPAGDDTFGAVAHIALSVEVEGDESWVDVVVTDETGAARTEEVGVFQGTCTDVTVAERAGKPEPLVAFRCEGEGARGALVHIVSRPPELVLLRDWLDDTTASFDDIGHLELEAGASIQTDY